MGNTSQQGRVVLSACRYPANVLDGNLETSPRWRVRLDGSPNPAVPRMLDPPGPAYQAHKALQQWCEQHAPAALFSAGDTIYIDSSAGVTSLPAMRMELPGRDLEAGLHRAYSEADGPYNIAVHPVDSIDDHEIIDNWEPSKDPLRNEALHVRRARTSEIFSMYRRGQPGSPLWGAEQGTAALPPRFVADTRTERQLRDGLGPARIMGGTQMAALTRFLTQQAGQTYGFRLVLSGSMVLPRRLTTKSHPATAARADSWDGYPASLNDLLATLAEQSVQGCIFLSGDEHLACAVEARVIRLDNKNLASTFWSVHAGAMYAPYPFANSRPEDFSDEPFFDFESSLSGKPRTYRCELSTAFGPVDTNGFVTVAWNHDAAGNRLRPTATLHTADASGLKDHPLMSPEGLGNLA